MPTPEIRLFIDDDGNLKLSTPVRNPDLLIAMLVDGLSTIVRMKEESMRKAAGPQIVAPPRDIVVPPGGMRIVPKNGSGA